MKLSMSLFAVIFSLLVGSASAGEPSSAGMVGKLSGKAWATNESGVRKLKTGSPIQSGDAIETGKGARVLIRFADDSTLTLGEQAHVIVDEMRYARSPGLDKQTLDIVKGVFRFVSGQLGAASKQDVLIRTPVASLGIRGTEFVGGELKVGMRAGRPHYGFQIRQGAIDVIAPGGTVSLEKPGEGTFLPLTRTAAPTPVRQWTPEEAAEADAALAF